MTREQLELLPEFLEILDIRFGYTDEHVEAVRAALAHIDALAAEVERLKARVAAMEGPPVGTCVICKLDVRPIHDGYFEDASGLRHLRCQEFARAEAANARATAAEAEVERLNAMRTPCEHCGGDYVATGLETGCPCRLAAEVERLKGITPELPPYPPNGEGMPRYGLRWNSPTEPLAVPMADGYWTPWHLANARATAAEQRVEFTEGLLRAGRARIDELEAKLDAVKADYEAALIRDHAAIKEWQRALQQAEQRVAEEVERNRHLHAAKEAVIARLREEESRYADIYVKLLAAEEDLGEATTAKEQAEREREEALTALRQVRAGAASAEREAQQAERTAAALADEVEKWRGAARVLCGAHVGVPQATCPVCDAAALRGALEKVRPDIAALLSLAPMRIACILAVINAALTPTKEEA